jgi:hypothetical protein
MDVSNVPQVSCSAPKVGVVSSLQLKVALSMTTSTPIAVPTVVPTVCSLIHDAISNHKTVKFQIKINNVSPAHLAIHLLEVIAILSKYKTVHLAHFPPQDFVSLSLLKTVSVLKEFVIHVFLVTHSLMADV